MSTVALRDTTVVTVCLPPVVRAGAAAVTCVGSALAAAAVGTGLTALTVATVGPAAGWAAAAILYAVASGVIAGGVGRSGGRRADSGSDGDGDGSGWRACLARRAIGSRWSCIAAAVCGPVTLAAAVNVGGGHRVPRSVIAGWAVTFGLVEAGWQTLVVTGLL